VHFVVGGLFDVKEADGEATTYAPQLSLIKNPYPMLSHRKKSRIVHYFAPSDRLGNLTIYELGYTFTMFENYIQSGDTDWAHELIAVLYRPSRPKTRKETASAWAGDRRQPLRGYESKVDDRKAMIATLPALVQQIVVFWFASCRQHIIQKYPKVFRQGKEGEDVGYGWSGVLMSLAGGVANLDQVSDQHHSNALIWLSMKEDEARDREQQIARSSLR
jgi:hypothetical protein